LKTQKTHRLGIIIPFLGISSKKGAALCQTTKQICKWILSLRIGVHEHTYSCAFQTKCGRLSTIGFPLKQGPLKLNSMLLHFFQLRKSHEIPTSTKAPANFHAIGFWGN
jgi:hypothetical protein